MLNSAPVAYLSTLQLHLEDNIATEFQSKFGEDFETQNDRGILNEQIHLISGLNPPKALIFRSNHASNALALAGNLPRDREKLLAQLQRALEGKESLRPWYLRGM